jgi:nucleoside-diphosphate-sugar epimerase
MNPNKNTQSIVVLGAGFLSKNITSYLINNSYKVDLIDRNMCDLLDKKSVSSLLKRIPPSSIFIIPAAITRLADEYIYNTKAAYEKNIQIIKNILEGLPNDTKKVIFLSTVDVYGINSTLPISELNKTEPHCFYSKSKLISEDILKKESKLKGFDLAILRLSGSYGQGDSKGSTLHRLVASAISEGSIYLFCNPNIERDYITANDVARITEQIIRNNTAGVFNVATGDSYSIFTISENIFSILGLKSNIKIQMGPYEERPFKVKFDTQYLLNNLTNFKMTSLEDGLKSYIDNFINNKNDK